VALAQCRAFFAANPSLRAVPYYDTAGAARAVAEAADPADAALASAVASEAYGLEILARELEDRADNQTRFFVLVRQDAEAPPLPAGGSPRSALLVETRDRPGALVRLLQPFADLGVNLSKLESRPGEHPWSYRFFMEVDAPADDPAMRLALKRAAGEAEQIRVLGSFRRWAAAP
jgi:prephenate dehydratase